MNVNSQVQTFQNSLFELDLMSVKRYPIAFMGILRMGVQSSIHKNIGHGKIDLKLDWLHPLGRGLSSADCLANGASSSPLSALVGSLCFTQRDIFRGSEILDILLEKGVNESNYLLNFRRPNNDGERKQQSITIQSTLSTATSVHGITTDTFGTVHGGVRLRKLAIEMDQKWASSSKWSNIAGVRMEQVGPIGDHGHSIHTDSYECPITFSGNQYDRMLVAKLEKEYTDSNDKHFSQYTVLVELGLPVSPSWLDFKRLKARRRQGVKLGPTFGSSSISCGTVIGDLAPHSAFPIGGFNSVRGYGEGAVGTGRSYFVATNELSFPVTGLVQGVVFADYGTDIGSGRRVRGDPAGARRKPGSAFGYGVGIRIESSFGPLRIDYAVNELHGKCTYFGLGYHE